MKKIVKNCKNFLNNLHDAGDLNQRHSQCVYETKILIKQFI